MVDNEPPRTSRRSDDRPVMGDHLELEEETVTVVDEPENPMSRFLVPAIAAVVVIVLVIVLIAIL